MGGKSLDFTKIRQSITKQTNTVRSSWTGELPKVVTVYLKFPVYNNKLLNMPRKRTVYASTERKKLTEHACDSDKMPDLYEKFCKVAIINIPQN